jgi:hypothetical protein
MGEGAGDNGRVSPDPARQIPDPGFAGDDGAADPALARVLADHGAGRAAYVDVLLSLQDTRLLVPVVAVLGETEVDERGLAHDKTSDMAAVLMTGADGRRALLAFTSTQSLAAWDPQARPVPVSATLAALSAVQEEAAALVVDVAGPVRVVVQGDDLRALAAGWRLARAGERVAWIGPSDASAIGPAGE